MSERWWAPQRPTVEPDAVVLALLEPGDLGSSLLAAHRAGAAAIETVSKGALPTAGGIVSAMAEARERFAPLVVSAIAKNLDSTYAGLLVRDVLDDAERGVLNLYRTAINKGVSPPIAAQRAAAVYGVPDRAMGKYAGLATDPRANPAALTDAADRVLLEHVSKVVAEETETVSKSGPYQEQPWDESKVRRDAEGQFARQASAVNPLAQEPKAGSLEWLRRRLGLGSGPAQVADVTAPAEPEAEESALPSMHEVRAARRTRGTRKTRSTRGTRATLTPTGRTRETASLTRDQALTRSLTPAQMQRLTRAQSERQTLQRDLNRASQAVVAHQAARDAAEGRVLPGLLRSVRDTTSTEYWDLDRPVSVIVDGADSSRFLAQMRDQAGSMSFPGASIFRWGHLQSIATNAEVSNRSGHVANLSGVSDQLHQELERREEEGRGTPYVAPDVTTVHPDDIRASAMPPKAYLAMARADVASRAGDARSEAPWVQVLELYRPFGQVDFDDDGNVIEDPGTAIVHFQAGDPDRPNDRYMPTVDEFVIADSARGAEHEVGRHAQLQLDPNQAYQLTNAPTDRPGARITPQRFWDPVNGVIVNRHFVKPIGEDDVDDLLGGSDVGKASQYEQQRPERAPVTSQQMREALGLRRWDESKVKRDAEGRFAEVDARESAVTASTRSTRRTRKTRGTRQTRVAATPLMRSQLTPTAERTRRLTAEQKRTRARDLTPTAFARSLAQSLTTAIDRARRRNPDLPELSDTSDFKLLTDTEYQSLIYAMADNDMDDLHVPGTDVRLNSVVRRALLEARNVPIAEVPDQMALNVDNDPTLRHKQFKVLRRIPLEALPDVDEFAEMINDLFDSHPDLAKIEITQHDDFIQLAGNREPAADQVIVEMDDDINFDEPLYMTYLGQYEARTLGVANAERELRPLIHPTGGVGEHSLEGVVANPSVHVYRVSTKRLRVGH